MLKSSGVGDLVKLTTAPSKNEECEIRATLLSDSFGSDVHLLPASGTQLVLHCPACNAETFLGDQFCQECGIIQPAFQDKPRFSSESVTGLIGFKRKHWIAISVCAVGLFAAAAVVSAINLPDQLEKTISANRLNEAADLAEKLYVSRFGALSGRDAEIYSQTFYKRAQVFAGNRNFKLALVDLSKVLPSFSRNAEVAQLKASYQLFLTQGNPDAEANANTVIEKRPALRQIKPNYVSQQSTSLVPAKSKAGTSAKSADGAIATPSEVQPVDSGTTDKEEVNSEEADMAAYNRHLAEYFSHEDPKTSKGAIAKEPPSFSEWVQTGKAEF